jgi:hypothetical protein
VLKLNLKLKFYETVSKHVAVGNGLRVLPTRRWVYAGSQRCPRTSFKMSYTSGRRKGSDIIHCPIDVKQTWAISCQCLCRQTSAPLWRWSAPEDRTNFNIKSTKSWQECGEKYTVRTPMVCSLH